MKAFFVLAAVIAAALAVSHPTTVQQEFDIFKSVHEKVYDNDVEEIKRLAIFRDNLIKIEEHNKLYEQGLTTYKMGVTVFADMTTEEFIAFVNSSQPEIQADEEDVVVSTVNAPVSIDWRQRGIVTPVKNQRQCGSCWAFSATGALEGQYALKYRQLLSLSEQNLVDCSGPYGNGGCRGGWMGNAFNYVRDHGIAHEQDYPYHASVGVCHSFVRSPVRVSGFIDFQSSVGNVQAACAAYGPLSAALYVSPALQHYRGGIFVDSSCENQPLNHGVLLVGYNGNSWTVKNSWGAQWGEGGTFRITNWATACGLITRTSVPRIV